MCATPVIMETHARTDSEADRLVTMLLPQVADAGKPILFRGDYFRILSNSDGRIAAIVPDHASLLRSDDLHRQAEWPCDRKRSRPKYDEYRRSND